MSRSSLDNTIYTFGPFRLSPEQGSLMRDSQRIALGHRAIEILMLLVERAGDVVSNAEINRRVWPDTVVDENNLRVHIAALRKALLESDPKTPYIFNVPGRGYRFVGQVMCNEPESGLGRQTELPVALTRLIGREAFVGKIIGALATSRFVTIVGAGGIGKTSVALAVAHEIKSRYQDGCCFIDLSLTTDRDRVPAAVAEAMRIPVVSETALAAIANHLRHRHLAIVLDNCEHVIDKAAEVVEFILRTASNVHVLATSREPLRAEGESIERISTLDVPPETNVPMTVDEVFTFPAAQLFAERAAAVVSSFKVADSEAPLLASLCRKLDGIPLAIELAAARIDVFGLAGLVAELNDSLAFLIKGRRTAQRRHRTLRATLDWSFDLLSDAEKTVFGRLGVFNVGFIREAVAPILADANLDAPSVVEALSNLVAKSLVVLRFANGGVFFRLLDPTRAYALEKFTKNPHADQVRARHARYFYELVSNPEFENLRNEVNWLANFRLVTAEIRAALQWCFSDSGDQNLGLLLTAASSYLWVNLSLVDEYIAYGRRALACIKESSQNTLRAEMKVLAAMGPALYNTQGSVPELPELYRRASEVAEKIGDLEGRKWAVLGTWQYCHGLGQHAEALLEVETYGRLDQGAESKNAQMRLTGITKAHQGHLVTARECLTHALRPFSAHGEPARRVTLYNPGAIARAALARVCWLQGYPSRALECAQESVSLAIASNHVMTVCYTTATAGCPVALWTGELAMAKHNLALLEERSLAFAVPFWHRFSQVYRYYLDSRTDATPNAAPLACNTVSKWSYRHLEEFSVLGEGYASDELIDRATSEDAIWCSAEILRLEAMRLVSGAGDDNIGSAKELLSHSLDIARRQGALAWELRTATSLARILQQEEQTGAARVLLQPLLERFPDRMETPDYLAAVGLLNKILL